MLRVTESLSTLVENHALILGRWRSLETLTIAISLVGVESSLWRFWWRREKEARNRRMSLEKRRTSLESFLSRCFAMKESREVKQ